VAVTAILWWLGRARPVDVVVFLLGLVVAYTSTIAAVALVAVREAVGGERA
jgi:hypothetical protein